MDPPCEPHTRQDGLHPQPERPLIRPANSPLTAGLQIRNIQLGGIGCLGALAAAFWKDGAAIQAAGFFQGYTPLVWSVVGQVGLGGLLVAMVVKYADNILKGFATSLSIIVSGLLSIYFIPALKFAPSPIWFAGTTLVLAATVLYSIPDRQPPKKQAA